MIQDKYRKLILCLIFIISIIVISGSISNIDLQQDLLQPYPEEEASGTSDALNEFDGSSDFILKCIIYAMMLLAILLLLMGKYRAAIIFFSIVLIVVIVRSCSGDSPPPKPPDMDDVFINLEKLPEEPSIWVEILKSLIPFKDRFFGEPSKWIVFLLSISISSLFVLSGFLLVRWFNSRITPSELIADQAQKTMKELQTGVDLKDGVMRCYYEMVNILVRYHNIRRPKSMTPREFEYYLKNAGFAIDDIHQLTKLFEMVRYSNQCMEKKEEQAAMDCLDAIIKFSKGIK